MRNCFDAFGDHAIRGNWVRRCGQAGIAGQKGSQILARVQSRVTTAGEFDAAFIDLGTNDIVQRAALYGSDVPTTIAATGPALEIAPVTPPALDDAPRVDMARSSEARRAASA